jgi:hypothetical protein
MADSFALHSSLEPQAQEHLMQNRQFVYIADSNSSSFGQQIVWDLAGISNSGLYLDCAQSFLTIPLVMTMTSTTWNLKNVSGENAFACSLKNGYSNLIHSMNIQCTNNSVVSTMSYSNLPINFKLLTTMSTDDEQNLGDSIDFRKDDVLSQTYKSASSTQGLGECNNQISPSIFNPTTGYGLSGTTQNKGRLARMLNTSYDPIITGESLQSVSSSGKNYAQHDTLGVLGKTVNHFITANVPLSVLSDFFKKFPICKGMYLQITLNLNVGCTTQLTIDGAGNYTAVSTSSQNNAVPYMISPCGVGSGLDITGTTPSTGIELSIAIARNSINKSGITYTHPSLTSCRFYACMYNPSPATEQAYLSKTGGTKKIVYEDFQTYQTLAVPGGGNFSQILSNGVARGRRVVGFPKISSTANYAGVGSTISTMASPFSSSPCTTAKNPITNYNILLSGSNLYQQNYNYSWEQFQQELRKTNSINGGSSIGLSSGLISQNDFENGYRFLVFDISRSASEATDNVAKSIQVIGTNSGDKAIDILWAVFYEREIEVDLATGSLIM